MGLARMCRRPGAEALRGLLLALVCLGVSTLSRADEPRRLLIAPHATDARLDEGDAPHLVVYDRDATSSSQPLLVWLPGTNGHPATGPAKFFATVLQQGYRLVGLSYLNGEAVSQVCTPRRVAQQPRCAEQFRQQRVWGDGGAVVLGDRPEDAIVPRLTRLLHHLVEADPAGQWAQYINENICPQADEDRRPPPEGVKPTRGGPSLACEPRWDRIVLAGQSQGGGMAAFLAQSRAVAGVVMFSGGWDHGRDGSIASWYKRPSQTPPQRWYGTFHVDENQAQTMAQIYRALGLVPEHIHALDLPVQGRAAHGEGITNPAYAPLWQAMLPKR